MDDLVRRLGIPADLARVVLVNGRDAETGRGLSAGDTVTIFPPLVGGKCEAGPFDGRAER